MHREPAHPESFHYYQQDTHCLLGQAVRVPNGTVMVWGHDFEAGPIAEEYLPLHLDNVDTFESAESLIARHTNSADVPVYLWLLERKDETDRGEMVSCVVAAEDENAARIIAATHARSEQTSVWYGTGLILNINCLGTAHPDTKPGMVHADVWLEI